MARSSSGDEASNRTHHDFWDWLLERFVLMTVFSLTSALPKISALFFLIACNKKKIKRIVWGF